MISEAQRGRRRRGIGGSDAVKLMAGRFEEVWAAKMHDEGPDLSGNLRVRIGNALEPLALACLAEAEGIEISEPGARTWADAEHEWMICHPDGLVVAPDFVGPVEVKVTWAHASAEAGVGHYYAQLQHNTRVLDAPGIWYGQLSLGGRGPVLHSAFVPRDEAYLARLLAVETVFWDHVARGEPPRDEELAPLVAPPPGEATAPVAIDLRASNVFAAAERDWLDNAAAARNFAAAEKTLRRAVPPEAGIAFGRELVLIRDRRGLAIRSLDEDWRRRLGRGAEEEAP